MNEALVKEHYYNKDFFAKADRLAEINKVRFNTTSKINVVSFCPSSTNDEQSRHRDRNHTTVVPSLATAWRCGAVLKRKNTPISPPHPILRLYRSN